MTIKVLKIEHGFCLGSIQKPEKKKICIIPKRPEEDLMLIPEV